MKNITLKRLLEAGCHFGHQVNRWNPKAKGFIYTTKDRIHVIDLAQTKANLEKAGEFVRSQAANGAKIIFVATKRQAKTVIEEEAKRVGAMYLTKRWPGGLFTNWEQIDKNINKIKTLESKLKSDEEKAKYTKYEVGLWQKELAKLMGLYGGIYNLEKIPEMIFIIDTKREQSAVQEAIRMGVKTIAIVDTNSDPNQIDYFIPANDDATSSIKLIVNYIAEAYKEGVELYNKKKADQAKEAMKPIKAKEVEVK